MTDFDVAFDKLAGFEYPDELAVFFRDEGVVGWPARAGSCPMARWLQRETGDRAAVTVSYSWPWPESHGQQHIISSMRREHSEAMQRFVIGFDSGWYPFLVDPTPRKPVC